MRYRETETGRQTGRQAGRQTDRVFVVNGGWVGGGGGDEGTHMDGKIVF